MTDRTTDTWFAALPTLQRIMLNQLRSLILDTVPDAREEQKWNRPCYSTRNGLFCYLHASKGHVTLGFHNGTSLADPQNLLEGDGKNMRHIKFRELADIDKESIRKMLTEAAL